MAHALTATVALIEGDRFSATTGSGGAADLAPAAEDGAPTGAVSPMEALLVALAGCLGMSVAPILRKLRQPVSRYEVRAHGELTARPPRVFEAIAVEHIFTGDGLDRHAIERAVALAEERYCGVSAMLGEAARITHTITLVSSSV